MNRNCKSVILGVIGHKERTTRLKSASYDNETDLRNRRLVGGLSTRREVQVRERLIFVCDDRLSEESPHTAGNVPSSEEDVQTCCQQEDSGFSARQQR